MMAQQCILMSQCMCRRSWGCDALRTSSADHHDYLCACSTLLAGLYAQVTPMHTLADKGFSPGLSGLQMTLEQFAGDVTGASGGCCIWHASLTLFYGDIRRGVN